MEIAVWREYMVYLRLPLATFRRAYVESIKSKQFYAGGLETLLTNGVQFAANREMPP